MTECHAVRLGNRNCPASVKENLIKAKDGCNKLNAFAIRGRYFTPTTESAPMLQTSQEALARAQT
jgi:hypothetical protein